MPLDLLAILVDTASIVSLILAGIVGWKAIQAFRQSKRAVVESASLIGVIVDALTARIRHWESITRKLRSEMETLAHHSEGLEGAQANLRTSHLQLFNQVQEILAIDKRLVLELEQLKTKFSTVQQRTPAAESLPKRENLSATTDGDILAATTPTEREVLEILRLEGSKAAPELGKRLDKSREHTSRLMKKLYMEGYVDRETNHAPFRYKLNDSLRPALESTGSVMTKPAETP
jgi:uncharacterized membrane protein